jgi:hypothetical protein
MMESDREKEVDMSTPDARHLTIETQEYLRQQAIQTETPHPFLRLNNRLPLRENLDFSIGQP